MRAHLCRLLLYLPSAVLYLKLQLQNLCNFSQTQSELFPENMCMWILLLFFSPLCSFLYLFMSFWIKRAITGSEVYVALSFTRCSFCSGREKCGFWLKEGQAFIVGHMHRERERKRGDAAHSEHTKSYFHQFVEVEINMSVAYLFQRLYFWVISRQMTRWGLV